MKKICIKIKKLLTNNPFPLIDVIRFCISRIVISDTRLIYGFPQKKKSIFFNVPDQVFARMSRREFSCSCFGKFCFSKFLKFQKFPSRHPCKNLICDIEKNVSKNPSWTRVKLPSIFFTEIKNIMKF